MTGCGRIEAANEFQVFARLFAAAAIRRTIGDAHHAPDAGRPGGAGRVRARDRVREPHAVFWVASGRSVHFVFMAQILVNIRHRH